MKLHGKLVVLALAGALVGTACATEDGVSGPDGDTSPAAVASPTTSAPDAAEALDPIAFRAAMRVLWNEHGSLTVRAIVAAVSGLDETGPVVTALQANQDKIGDAIKPLYGDEAGQALAELLHEHIDTAVATLTAAIGGDQSELERAAAAFYANGDEIAAFLVTANPDNWQLETMEAMMTMHLDQVIELATAQIEGEYEQALAVYTDYIHHLNIGMADMLSDGIVAQFPDQF